MLSELVKMELEKRDLLEKTKFAKKFKVINHFFGYQGRSSHPSIFDRQLANTCGYTAGVNLLIFPLKIILLRVWYPMEERDTV